MRLLAVLTLVIVLPLTGLRVVCLDGDETGGVAGPQLAAAAGTPDEAACVHSCALHAKRTSRPACRLVAGDDEVCSFVIDGVIAVLHRGAELPMALTVSPFAFVPTVGAYSAPMLAPPGPPPKV